MEGGALDRAEVKNQEREMLEKRSMAHAETDEDGSDLSANGETGENSNIKMEGLENKTQCLEKERRELQERVETTCLSGRANIGQE
jgi:hypothetical protein